MEARRRNELRRRDGAFGLGRDVGRGRERLLGEGRVGDGDEMSSLGTDGLGHCRPGGRPGAGRRRAGRELDGRFWGKVWGWGGLGGPF